MPAPVPQSNVEKYLFVIAGHSTEVPTEPTSRVEYYLAEIVSQGGIGGKLKPRPVTALPATGESGILYLLPVQGASGQNTHDEYVWIEEESKYELLGQAKIEIDLSNYALKSELPTKVSELANDSGYLTEHQDISGKVDKEAGKGLSTEDYTTEEKRQIAANGDALSELRAENALLKELIEGVDAPIYRSVSGAPATFSDGYPANVKALSVAFVPTQSGSGDPSPDNVRPISNLSSVTVTRTGENGDSPKSVTVALVDSNNDPLTVYGGELNVTTGELTVTHYAVTIDGSGVKATSLDTFASNKRASVPYPSGKAPAYIGANSFCLCDKMPVSFSATIGNPNLATNIGCFAHSANILVTFPSSSGVTTLAAANAYFAQRKPVVAYKLSSPVTYQLSPAQLDTLSGYNAVSFDNGSLSVTYRADPALSIGETSS